MISFSFFIICFDLDSFAVNFGGLVESESYSVIACLHILSSEYFVDELT